jgi:NAD(P)-dependent dehydrogenase (short-subunit alcohol dehydrogenase family)
MPDQAGKVFAITGANSGLGFEAARVLALKGASVVMACRDADKGSQAANLILQETPPGTLEVLSLDLANLQSVRLFAETVLRRFTRLDGLLNNAGVMHVPYRETADGFEMHFGTNHLGHFALTGRLLPLLLSTPQARVVTTSSTRHRPGQIHFADLNARHNYDAVRAYSQSKLANLLFSYELQRKFSAAGVNAISVAAHPGYAATNLQFVGPRMQGSAWMEMMMGLGNRFVAQSAAMGALPLLYAATAADVQGGEYFGPDGLFEIRGYPIRVTSNAASLDLQVAQQLWTLSEEFTGVRYEPIFAAARS